MKPNRKRILLAWGMAAILLVGNSLTLFAETLSPQVGTEEPILGTQVEEPQEPQVDPEDEPASEPEEEPDAPLGEPEPPLEEPSEEPPQPEDLLPEGETNQLPIPVELPAALNEVLPTAEPANEPQIVGNNVYANGVAIVIEADPDGTVYIRYGEDGKLELPSPKGKTIYGGGYNIDVDGDTNVTINGVAVRAVYGGGYSDGGGSADVSGDTHVTTTGEILVKTYGGGHAVSQKGDASARVTGTAYTQNEAFGPVPGEGFTKKGHYIYGGGDANSSNEYEADATVGAVDLQVVEGGATYEVRGGGVANATSSGAAIADVQGRISLSLSGLDVREVYSGGNASGANASATAGEISCTVERSEMMIYKCGTASGGNASVSGLASTILVDCPNLYGYVRGGGDASKGGNASIERVELTLTGCQIPGEIQFNDPVAAPVYGGGTASGAGSNAQVGSVSICLENSMIPGSIYGSGKASDGGIATVGSTEIKLNGVTGQRDLPERPGMAAFCTVLGGTDSDDGFASVLDRCSITIADSEVQHIWGGDMEIMPVPSGTRESTLHLLSGNTQLATIAHFDSIALTEPISIVDFFTKTGVYTDSTAIQLLGDGWADGQAAISHVFQEGETDLEQWFVGEGFDLTYHKDGNDVTWTVGNRSAGDIVIDSEIAEGAPETQLPQEKAAEIADAVLTEEEKEQVQNGSTIKIYPKVEAIALDGDSQIAQAVKENLQGETVGISLDIQLFKKVGSLAAEPVTETSAPIPVVIQLPENLWAPAGMVRTFTVIRVHQRPGGGLEVQRLPDLDSDPKTATVLTDRFSTYVLTYTEDKEDNGSHSGSSHRSGSSGRESIWPEVKEAIQKATAGEMVKADARWESNLPASVLCLLRERQVVLELRYPDGTVTLDGATLGEIPEYKLYYTFDQLPDGLPTAAPSSQGSGALQPENTGTATSWKPNPSTGR